MTVKLANDTFAETSDNFRKLQSQADQVAKAGELAVQTLKNGGHIFLCGNGGSASDAQHIAAELVGRFLKERRPLPSTALHCNTSTITAVANDYSYDVIYSRQLEGLGRKGDLLIALSTSGNSKNIVKCAESAKAMGIKVIGMTGEQTGALGPLCDMCLAVPAKATARVQEMHIAIGHVICAMIDDAY